MPRRQSSSRPAGGPGGSCRGQALAILAARGRSEEELRRKLLERGYAEDQVAATVSELVECRALNEATSAEIFVRLRRHRWGPERLEIELRRRLFKEETIRGALADFSVDDELILARRLTAGKGPAMTSAGERRRLFARLRRKGISAPTAIRIVGLDAGANE